MISRARPAQELKKLKSETGQFRFETNRVESYALKPSYVYSEIDTLLATCSKRITSDLSYYSTLPYDTIPHFFHTSAIIPQSVASDLLAILSDPVQLYMTLSVLLSPAQSCLAL